MVTSVEAVSGVSMMKRDRRRDARSDSEQNGAEGLFAKILEENTRETKNTVVNCHTTTYGSDSKMQNFNYQTREYRY